MTQPAEYSAEAVFTDDTLSDIRIHVGGKVWHLWGRKGAAREIDLAGKVGENTLPVLLGSGLGACLNRLVKQGGPVAVVDREAAINDITELKAAYGDHPSVLWLDEGSSQAALDRLTRWQRDNGGRPFEPIILPLYLRLDRPYYGALADTLKANRATDFWSQVRYPKFTHTKPRVLFLDSSYFLCGEILSALEKLEVEYHALKLDGGPTGSRTFVEDLLKAVVDFRPDFVLTVNHFGLDREGKLAGLLEDLGLPLASWFVDNPHLILHDYSHPGADNTAIFTYDAGNLDVMRAKGFANVHYLPLATDPQRFKPGLGSMTESWRSDVSFVGNSMTGPVEKTLNDAALPPEMQREYEDVAAAFGESGESNPLDFLKSERRDWFDAISALPTPERRLAAESLLTWEATRQYRLACVQGIIPFAPLIVGDDGWLEQIQAGYWRHLSSIDYYEDLPRFYPCSKINFNCTSRQMIGAVNQRIFDAPACGAFVLTDYREQMEYLFDLDTEVAIYRHPGEIPELVERYLGDDNGRETIARAARKRILADHTYAHRLKSLLATMRHTFG